MVHSKQSGAIITRGKNTLIIQKPTNTTWKSVSSSIDYFSTQDYSIFDRVNSNRNVDQKWVETLAALILEKDQLKSNPLNVKESLNGKLFVMEGQHRLAAVEYIFKTTGIRKKVYFIVDNDFQVSDIPKINSNRRKWNPGNYTSHYIKEGKNDYNTLLLFTKKHGLSINNSIGLLSGKGSNPNSNLIKEFQTGGFEVTDFSHAEKVMKYLKDFQKYNIKNLSSKTFLVVLSKITTLDDYDHKWMLLKMDVKFRKFRECSTMEEFKKIFADIYNHENNKPIDFNLI